MIFCRKRLPRRPRRLLRGRMVREPSRPKPMTILSGRLQHPRLWGMTVPPQAKLEARVPAAVLDAPLPVPDTIVAGEAGAKAAVAAGVEAKGAVAAEASHAGTDKKSISAAGLAANAATGLLDGSLVHLKAKRGAVLVAVGAADRQSFLLQTACPLELCPVQHVQVSHLCLGLGGQPPS